MFPFLLTVEFFIPGRRPPAFVVRSWFQSRRPTATRRWRRRAMFYRPRETEDEGRLTADKGKETTDSWIEFDSAGLGSRCGVRRSLSSRRGLGHIFLAVKASERQTKGASDLWKADSLPELLRHFTSCSRRSASMKTDQSLHSSIDTN